MWLAGLVLVCALPVQGELKMTLESAVYPSADTSPVLEVSYEIPYTSLTFTRDSGTYVARFKLSVELYDKRNLVAGDMWRKSVRAEQYDPTVARDSLVAGSVQLALPRGVTSAQVYVSDLESDRRASAEFPVMRPTGGLVVRLLKSGRAGLVHKYRLGDTLTAKAELAGPPAESCRFAVRRGTRVFAGTTAPFVDSAGHRVARFDYPIAETSGIARIGAGDYSLDVAVPGTARPASTTVPFSVDVPFFQDDSAYFEKVAQLQYVGTVEEMRRLKAVPREGREKAWGDFWKTKDRTPTTGRNESEETYFERIDYAEEHFRGGDRGWRSDRGQVYVVFGPPDQIDSRPFEIDSPAYETWYYYQPNRTFIFVDQYGAGEYVLQNREALDEH